MENKKTTEKKQTVVAKLSDDFQIKTSSGKVNEHKAIVDDFVKSNGDYGVMYSLFLKRRENTTKDSSRERFIAYNNHAKTRSIAKKQGIELPFITVK